MSSMIIVALFAFGLIFGSFANATIWRLHAQTKVRRKANGSNLSIVTGRSQCMHCGHILAAHDLVPVLSYAMLRGKCRYCRKPIPDTPVAELLTAGLFVLSYLWWPFDLGNIGVRLEWAVFSFWLLILVCFVILALYDLRWFLLPDRVVFPTIGFAAVLVALRMVQLGQVGPGLIDAFWGIVLIAGLFYGLYAFSKGAWIGFGDVKLGIALGLLVGGPLPSLLVIFLASLGGSLAALPLVLRGKPIAKTRVPFGPFLLAATVVVMLFGSTIVTMYLDLLNPTAHL